MIVRRNRPVPASCSVEIGQRAGMQQVAALVADRPCTMGREIASGIGFTACTTASSNVSSTTSVPTG